MKVRGSLYPDIFSIEEQPNRPGSVLVRFHENVKQDGSEWEYDEYTLELLWEFTIENDIRSNYEMYLSQAKRREESSKRYNPIETEQIRADIDYISIMTGVDLL